MIRRLQAVMKRHGMLKNHNIVRTFHKLLKKKINFRPRPVLSPIYRVKSSLYHSLKTLLKNSGAKKNKMKAIMRDV